MIIATAYDDGSGVLAIDSETQENVSTGSVDAAREALITKVRDHARQRGQTMRVLAVDPSGRWELDVQPDGSVHPAPTTPEDHLQTKDTETDGEPDTAETPVYVEPPRPATPTAPAPPSPVPTTPVPPSPQTATQVSEGPAQQQEMTRRAAREQSFLTSPQRTEAPATTGWRGVLTSLGIKVSPSAAEISQRDDVRAVSRHWAGPRTIAVVNGKGGASKTPTTAMLAAVMARYGGGGVLAWDNNDTRGTLGWRTEPGAHEAHVRDLLPHVDRLMDPSARAADIAAYVHHQSVDKYDVLRSNPASLPGDQRLTQADFDAVHRVASRYFRLMLIDSGNAEDAPHWLRMIDHADQLVVATTTRSDHAEAARLLLNSLHERDPRSAGLADGAVVVVSQADRDEKPAAEVAEHYRGLARAAVTIPYDRAMRADWLRYDALSAPTQRAWLRAAAAVAGGL